MTQPTTTASSAPSAVPPDIARYLKGAGPQSRQFDFLIGRWTVAAEVFNPDGSLLRQYTARWDAQSLNNGRMVMDDFRAQGPNGQDISSFVTLRTWSELTNRWEITGLGALQPTINMQWHGQWQQGEMQMEAVGTDPAGATVHTRIRFFAIEAQAFRWESQVSRDAGNTWCKAAALRASRLD